MRITSRVLHAVFATLLLGTLFRSSPVSAQEELPADIGIVGRYTLFDDAPGFDDAVGIGGRVMAFFLPRWGLEVDGIYTSTDGPPAYWPNVSYFTTHGRLLYGLPLSDTNRSHLLFGLGYVHNKYGRDPSWQDSGIGGLVGVRFGLNRRWSLRFDGTYDYMPGSGEIADFGHIGLQAGIGYNPLWFSKRPDRKHGGSAMGMDMDSDRDGVMDSRDNCPGTPYGTPVDAFGCPQERDSDGDGVMDSSDRCPNTPRGERVDAYGCPSARDSDGDGVADAIDRCPNTPRGERVDATGCPDLFKGGTSLILEGVNFETAKSVLTPDSRGILDRVAESLNNNPTVRVEVAGHTDSRGSREMNQGLSRARAQAVVDYLASRGVSSDRMVAAGYGPDRPVDSNATADGRARNRRTELTRLN